MFSSIWNETSVSGNRCSLARPTGTCRKSAISSVSALWALPEKILSWPLAMVAGKAPVVIIGAWLSFDEAQDNPEQNRRVGAGGFEPPNTGSKVPRLTAWPRPKTIENCGIRELKTSILAIPQFPDSPIGFPRPPGIDKCSGSTVYGQPFGVADGEPSSVEKQPAWRAARARRGSACE